jgi:hypothetical protein
LLSPQLAIGGSIVVEGSLVLVVLVVIASDSLPLGSCVVDSVAVPLMSVVAVIVVVVIASVALPVKDVPALSSPHPAAATRTRALRWRIVVRLVLTFMLGYLSDDRTVGSLAAPGRVRPGPIKLRRG